MRYDHLHLVQIAEARAAFERSLELTPIASLRSSGSAIPFATFIQLDDAERTIPEVLELEPGHGGASMGLGHTLRFAQSPRRGARCVSGPR